MTAWQFIIMAAAIWPLAFVVGAGLGQLMPSGRTHVGKGTKGAIR